MKDNLANKLGILWMKDRYYPTGKVGSLITRLDVYFRQIQWLSSSLPEGKDQNLDYFSALNAYQIV